MDLFSVKYISNEYLLVGCLSKKLRRKESFSSSIGRDIMFSNANEDPLIYAITIKLVLKLFYFVILPNCIEHTV